MLLAAGDSAAAQEAWLQSEISAFEEDEDVDEDEDAEGEDAPQLEPHLTGQEHEAAGAAINGGEGGAPVAKPIAPLLLIGPGLAALLVPQPQPRPRPLRAGHH